MTLKVVDALSDLINAGYAGWSNLDQLVGDGLGNGEGTSPEHRKSISP